MLVNACEKEFGRDIDRSASGPSSAIRDGDGAVVSVCCDADGMLWVLGEACEVGELIERSLACERGELEIAAERDWREGWLAEEAQFLEGACCGDDVATERNEVSSEVVGKVNSHQSG